jgi:hypothetical protein
MRVTYLQTLPTRAGERIPVQDVEDGEKFRVVSQDGMYFTNARLDRLKPEDCTKYRRVGDAVQRLEAVKDTFKWRKSNSTFFLDNPTGQDGKYAPWMNMLKTGGATVIVEIY